MSTFNIDDSIFAIVASPLDAKLCNWTYTGYTLTIETIEMYLQRVPRRESGDNAFYRSPGVIVTILLPKVGEGPFTYTGNDFYTNLHNFDVKYYTFVGGVEDEHFIELAFNIKSKINLPWHVRGAIFYSNLDNDTDITYTSGNIFINEFTPNVERSWSISGTTLTLDTTPVLLIFAKLPKDVDSTSAEIIITPDYNQEDAYEGFIYILMGVINQNINGVRVFSMTCGDDYYFPKIPIVPPIPQIRRVVDYVFCVKVPATDYNTGMQTTISHLEIEDLVNGGWIPYDIEDPDAIVTTSNLTACPLPEYETQDVFVSGICQEVEGYKNGTYIKTYKRQTRLAGTNDPWVDTGYTYPVTEYNITECPVLEYRAAISVGRGDSFNPLAETNVTPFIFDRITTVYSVLLPGYNFVFVSVPVGKQFIFANTLIDLTDDLLANPAGTDNREGFRDNVVYKYPDVFNTEDNPCKFFLTVRNY